MKNSGIEWIGEIPDSWEVNLVKNIFDITRGRVIAKTEIEDEPLEDYYPVYSSQTANSGILGYIPSYDFAVDSLTWTTDGAKAGTVFLRRGKYSITNVCGILTLKSKKYSLDYLNYAVGFSAYNCRRADINGYKIMSNEMAIIPIVVPYLEEQQRIAKHLDEKCGKIDELIANQQGQIEKLKEYKQSVITEAVTKGLDKSAPLKDSGIEWIGEIPASWRCLKSAYVYNKIGDIDHCMPASVNDGYPYVMTGDLHGFASEINFEACKKVSKIDYEQLSRKISPNRGDIIFARYATIGTVCYVDIDKDFLASYSCVTIKPKTDRVNGKYLWRYYQSLVFLEEVKKLVNSNTQANVGIDSLYRANLVIPPLPEQQQIVDYLDEKCGKIDHLIAIEQEKIEKLQEYKKSLIYEYVTGKKEVV